ncbi:MAG TPA: amidohydrolase family protein [Chloroflexota bacterium]
MSSRLTIPIIDVHAHCVPLAYAGLQRRMQAATAPEPYTTAAGLTPPPLTDSPEHIRARLELMDAAGVEMQVLSLPAGPVSPDADRALEAARLINDSYSALVRAHPDRFAAYATLPLPHAQESLQELRRALDELGLCGVVMACSIQRTRSPVEEEFEPIFAELNRRGAALYFHPSGNGLCSPFLNDYGLAFATGAPMEDTTLVTHLMARAIPTRYPDIKIIVAHYGGALAMLLSRLDHVAPQRMSGLAELPSVTARRLYYDTVGHGSDIAFRAACGAFGVEHLLAGSDYPITLYFEPYAANFDHIQKSDLPPADITRVLSGNARQLLQLRVGP